MAEILIPSLRSSPRIRWYPQRGFSLPEPDDEIPDVGVDRRPARLTRLPEGPLLLDEFPMPTEQGLRPHHERGPAAFRQPRARGCEQDPVERAEPRTLHLALEHLHLVAEHQELDVSLVCSTTSRSEDTTDQEVQE